MSSTCARQRSRALLATATSTTLPAPSNVLNLSTFKEAVRNARVELLDGGVTRFLSVLLLYPLDVAKSRAQLRHARNVPKLEHLLRAPRFRGGVAALLGQIPYGIITYGVYAVLSRRASSMRSRVVAACTADSLGAAWLIPAEAAKLRAQAGVYGTAGVAFREAFPWPLRMYSGLFAQLIRDVPVRALQMVLFEKMRNRVAKDREISTAESAAVAAGVGAFVGAITTPLDLVKTRVMAQRVGAATLYGNCVTCAVNVARHEGPAAFFKGVLPRTVYTALSVTLFTLGFELTSRTLSKNNWLWHRTLAPKTPEKDETNNKKQRRK